MRVENRLSRAEGDLRRRLLDQLATAVKADPGLRPLLDRLPTDELAKMVRTWRWLQTEATDEEVLALARGEGGAP